MYTDMEYPDDSQYTDEEYSDDITILNGTHVQIQYNDTHSVVMYYPTGDYDNGGFHNGCDPHDIRDNMTADDTAGYFLFFNTFLPIICVSGIIGIILTVIVLSRKNMATSTNAYLTFLAIADLGFLTLLTTTIYNVKKLTLQQAYLYIIYTEYANIFVHAFLLASVWLTVMLAIERYIAICHPLRAISICTTRRARIIICLIFLFSFLCRVPNFFEYKVTQSKTTPCDNAELLYHMSLTELGFNLRYKRIYSWVVDCVLCAILPFLLLLYFNIRLIMEIHKSSKYLRYHLGVDSNMQTMVSSEQIKITMMLVGIIIVFFVCQAPIVGAVAYKNLVGNVEVSRIILCVTIILLALKSALNFIIYCWFSEKFWSTFKRVFCHRNCLSKHKLQVKNHTNTVHSADQNGGNSVRKPSYLTKDTVC